MQPRPYTRSLLTATFGLALLVAAPAAAADPTLESIARYQWAKAHPPERGGLLADPAFAYTYEWSGNDETLPQPEGQTPVAAALALLRRPTGGVALDATLLADLERLLTHPEALAGEAVGLTLPYLETDRLAYPTPFWLLKLAHSEADQPVTPALSVLPPSVLRREDFGIGPVTRARPEPWQAVKGPQAKLMAKLCPRPGAPYRCGRARAVFEEVTAGSELEGPTRYALAASTSCVADATPSERLPDADAERLGWFYTYGPIWTIPEAMRSCPYPEGEGEEYVDKPHPPPEHRYFVDRREAPTVLLERAHEWIGDCDAFEQDTSAIVRWDDRGRARWIASVARPAGSALGKVSILVPRWSPDARHVVAADAVDLTPGEDGWRLQRLGYRAAAPLDRRDDALARAMTSGTPCERHVAALLGAHAKVMTPVLEKALVRAAADPDARVRAHAAEGLARCRGAALATLAGMIADADRMVAVTAMDRLHEVRPVPEAAIPGLTACASGTGELVTTCKQMLAQARPAQRGEATAVCAKPGVAALAAQMRTGSYVEKVNAASCLSLLGRGAAAAAPAARERLADSREEFHVRRLALEVLTHVDPPEQTVATLTRILDDTQLAPAAARMLGELGPTARPAVPRLVALLGRSDPAPSWQEEAETAVRRIRGETRPAVAVAVASSSLAAQGASRYDPAMAIDGKRGTAWCEGVEGRGEGQWIELALGSWGDRPLCGVELVPGYAKSQAAYTGNGRIRRIALSPCHDPRSGVPPERYAADPAEPRVELTLGQGDLPAVPDAFDAPAVRLAIQPMNVQRDLACVRVTILETVPGKDADTCISEVSPIFGTAGDYVWSCASSMP